MEDKNINLTLKIWRQESATAKGDFEEFKVSVFAQEIKPAFKISEKKLNKFADKISRMV